jgi:hypothetical protein
MVAGAAELAHVVPRLVLGPRERFMIKVGMLSLLIDKGPRARSGCACGRLMTATRVNNPVNGAEAEFRERARVIAAALDLVPQ